MDNPSYVTLSRQSGLIKSMEIIANNIANISTDGYRREGAIFSEVVSQLDAASGSSSQASARARVTDFSQAALNRTGGTLDFAIEGDGFFQIETQAGPRLTRAGSFTVNAGGELVTSSGDRVLGEGAAPVFVPTDAQSIDVATDGSISADGQPVGRIAVFTVADQALLRRAADGLFESPEPPAEAEDAAVFQGFLEGSNVSPVSEIAAMIQVQRAYELGQSFLTTEDERMRQAIRTMGATA